MLCGRCGRCGRWLTGEPPKRNPAPRSLPVNKRYSTWRSEGYVAAKLRRRCAFADAMVYKYIQHILEKLRVRNRTQALALRVLVVLPNVA